MPGRTKHNLPIKGRVKGNGMARGKKARGVIKHRVKNRGGGR